MDVSAARYALFVGRRSMSCSSSDVALLSVTSRSYE